MKILYINFSGLRVTKTGRVGTVYVQNAITFGGLAAQAALFLSEILTRARFKQGHLKRTQSSPSSAAASAPRPSAFGCSPNSIILVQVVFEARSGYLLSDTAGF
ncbi:hypothetical protein EVAR_83418_1 [Eumeta japonica]|uniref:Uncharacterized protein n=1 Tax=Eumeta variegata TaxID=151549 RepID=A0A4C1TYH5_EUMVA|nr:hypothetical protein EVAR_83418_1 [Eumeta japonica]